MTYKRFEDLPVWQAGQDLALRVYRLTDDRAFAIKGDLADQLRRAALSVSNNVAESFERGSTASACYSAATTSLELTPRTPLENRVGWSDSLIFSRRLRTSGRTDRSPSAACCLRRSI